MLTARKLGGLLVMACVVAGCGGSGGTAAPHGAASTKTQTTIGALTLPNMMSQGLTYDGPMAQYMFAVACTDLAAFVSAPLPAIAVKGYTARCYEDGYALDDGTLARPTESQPQTGAIVYADASIDPKRSSLEDILNSGGITIAGGAQLPNSTNPPSGSTKSSATQAVRDIEGIMTVVRRVAENRVVAIWWDTAPGLTRALEWDLFTAGSPDEALAEAQAAQSSVHGS